MLVCFVIALDLFEGFIFVWSLGIWVVINLLSTLTIGSATRYVQPAPRLHPFLEKVWAKSVAVFAYTASIAGKGLLATDSSHSFERPADRS